jgi:hypothetical protein
MELSSKSFDVLKNQNKRLSRGKLSMRTAGKRVFSYLKRAIGSFSRSPTIFLTAVFLKHVQSTPKRYMLLLGAFVPAIGVIFG